ALQALAADREMQVLYRTEVVGNRQTSGVAGEFTLDEALGKLLNGTGLSFKYLDDKTITIVPTPVPVAPQRVAPAPPADTNGGEKPSSRDRLHLAQVDAASAATSERVELEEVVVALPEVLVTGGKSLNMDIRRSRDDIQPYQVFDRARIE